MGKCSISISKRSTLEGIAVVRREVSLALFTRQQGQGDRVFPRADDRQQTKLYEVAALLFDVVVRLAAQLTKQIQRDTKHPRNLLYRELT